MSPIAEELKEIVGDQAVHSREPLSGYTSFKIGGPAEWLVEPSSEAEIKEIVEWCRQRCLPLNVMGLGSNILVSDAGMPGVVMRLGDRFSAIDVLNDRLDCDSRYSRADSRIPMRQSSLNSLSHPMDSQQNCGKDAFGTVWSSGLDAHAIAMDVDAIMGDLDCVRIYAQAGASNEAVAEVALAQGLSGYEFASGIPGSVGGAAIMNAGAYGGEFKDVAESVRCLTSDGEFIEVSADEADWSYRHSLMMDRGYIVLGATLALHKGDPKVIAATMADLTHRREEKQPLELPSAGSTFKRPQGHYAGQLIQEAGLRGYRIGGAQVSDKHCGFVVNSSQATAQDIRDLIAYVQQRVRDMSGVYLEPEVRLWGFPTE